MRINNYKNFFKEREFQSILEEMFYLVESEGRWINDRTIEWDLTGEKEKEEKREFEWDFTSNLKEVKSPFSPIIRKLKSFLSGLDKEEVKLYFNKFVDGIKSFPKTIRKKLILGYMSAFLAFVSLDYLIGDDSNSANSLRPTSVEIPFDIKNEIEETVTGGVSFDKAQKIVKSVEAGYSDDRGDTGNWIEIPGYGQRFVGTNHGISAPVLAEYLGTYPKKEDMMNLSYETALKIYKKNYWNSQNLGLLKNQSLANVLYDGCVNQGIGAMSDILKIIFDDNGIDIDGSPFAKRNIEKLNKLNPEKTFNQIKELRLGRYQKAETWERHGEGWTNRLNSIEYNS
jgi:lysozyme family protein